jgi:tRNA U34 2-thiouridine synthase MnmA/TrmU
VAGEPQAGAHATLRLDLAEPVDGAAPGQLACLMDGDVVVGWGTIARG